MQDPGNFVPPVIEKLGNSLSEAFRGAGHLTLADAIIERFSNRQGCDLMSITQHLIDHDLLDAAGGVGQVTEVSMAAPTTAIFKEHMDEVQRKAVLVRLTKCCDKIRTECLQYNDHGNPQDLISIAESEFLGIRSDYKKQGDNLAHISLCVTEAMEQIEAAYKNRGNAVQPGCVPSGFKDMDRMLTGFKPDQLIILGARPSVGKSALALNIITHAVKENFGCLFFSLEMGRGQQTSRMICSESGITLQRIKDGLMSKDDLRKIGNTGASLSQKRFWIETTAGITLHELRSIARRMAYKKEIDFIVIDYLQLMKCPSRRADNNRALEISDITSGLKQLAMELHIPIMALSQLNRDAERSGMPKASNLRESGSIEQDADIIILMDRDKADKNEVCRISIEKQRDGATGPLELWFTGENTKFHDMTPELYSVKEENQQKTYRKS